MLLTHLPGEPAVSSMRWPACSIRWCGVQSLCAMRPRLLRIYKNSGHGLRILRVATLRFAAGDYYSIYDITVDRVDHGLMVIAVRAFRGCSSQPVPSAHLTSPYRSGMRFSSPVPARLLRVQWRFADAQITFMPPRGGFVNPALSQISAETNKVKLLNSDIRIPGIFIREG